VANAARVGFILEAPTWRASQDWAVQLGYSSSRLADANRHAIDLLVNIREDLGEESGPLVISAAIGPRGDAYDPDRLMTSQEAQQYHSEQMETLADTATDLVTALTITHAAEAIGIVRAAEIMGLPVVVSFTVETNGALPDGSSLAAAIAEVDLATNARPAYYGINCAHPAHFVGVLDADSDWIRRLRMIRSNASRMSHAELDDASELDDGDPREFGHDHARVLSTFPGINVLGGCCGTDIRHIEALAQACL
jgi:homocysteine S-methyltransferase